MELEFVGAAQTVTGSMHLLRTTDAEVLLDCGLFQGRRNEANERNRNIPIDPSTIDAVVLSHAHIDHSGALPLLAKRGYEGDVYCTPATRDLCTAMLQDAAMIQASDARTINRRIERDGADMARVEPLYDPEDVVHILSKMISLPYHRSHTIAPGVTLSFLDAGHVLGSAITVLDVEENRRRIRVVFTGDLGRRNMPILRDPEIADGAHVLISESTYGDRLHKPIGAMEDELAEVVKRTHARGGKIVIPSFALERAQEVVVALKSLHKDGRLPKMKVYVDSPLTVKITDVFKMHPECFDEDMRRLLRSPDSPFDFPGLEYVSSVEDSMAIDASHEPAIVISASGMCEAGRVLHHLQATVEDSKNTVLIVGFQAQHTLGRRIVERRPDIRIFGVERPLHAEVVVLNGFSAHADQKDLVEYVEAVHQRGKLQHVALVHGEPKPQGILKGLLDAKGFSSVITPARGDRLQL